MKKFSVLFLLLIAALSAKSQQWVESMRDYRVSIYEVENQFEAYWEANAKSNKKQGGIFRSSHADDGFGHNQFKRWQNFWEDRVDANGMRPEPAFVYTQLMNAKKAAGNNNLGDWQPIGPYDAPSTDGIGRINCITFHPTNNNILWIGTPAGGLWKSTDAGVTWSTNTDQLTNLGVSGIAIDPLHPDTMYIATGDRDGADTYTFGVLKSVDGGQNWKPTGLAYNVSQNSRVCAIHVLPSNTNVILAATRSSIMRSTDGGATFTATQSGQFNMLAPDPSNPNTIFAGTAGNDIYRTRDGGLTWTQLTSGLPTSGKNRVEITVSPQDSNYVYAVYSLSADNGFGGLYRSINGGDTWTLRSTTPNILNGSTTGSGAGGQGWYDLCIAVSPTNKERIFVGGVNIYRSNNGGSGWSMIAHWYGGGAPYVHADIHWFKFRPGIDELYVGTDGGVSKTGNNGISWTNLYNNMNITQYYKISQSATNPLMIIGGAQDNGTHRKLGATWSKINGGDGMDNAIDPSNNNLVFASSQYGNFSRSTTAGSSFTYMNFAANGTGNWVTPIQIDPVNSSIVYIGYDRLWKSTNKGLNWSQTSTSTVGGGNIDGFQIAKSNNQVIYVYINSNLYRSNNAGVTYTNVSNGLIGNNNITGLAISAADENKVWVTRSGYSGNNKVFATINGGQTWTNVSAGLPNLPVNCVVYEENTLDGIYVGTDIGVYYRDAQLNAWAPFFEGLPNVIVRDLEIFYPDKKLRAGTYGRGVWESDLFGGFKQEPVADFSVNPFAPCDINQIANLVDQSSGVVTAWQWSITPNTYTFTGGTNANSQNPIVILNAMGTYSVSLTVSNAYGATSVTKTQAIQVGGKTLPFVEDFESENALNNWTIVNPDNGITWQKEVVPAAQANNNAMAIDFYRYTTVGQQDELISPALNFTGYTGINLSFDHAYKRVDATSTDSLLVYISTNCGQSWTKLQGYGENGTGNFATGAALGTNFTPASGADWCFGKTTPNCKTISLSSYAGSDQVQIKFVSKSGNGNKLYLDNINISGTASQKPVANFSNTAAACAGTAVTFYDASSYNATSWAWSFVGGTPATSTVKNPTVTYATGGTYNVQLIAGNSVGTDTVVKTATLVVSVPSVPTLNITAPKTAVCGNESVTVTANSANMGSNPLVFWYVNGVFRTSGTTTLTLNGIKNNDVVRAVMLPQISCVTLDSLASNALTFTVSPAPVVGLTSFATVCAGDAPFTLTGGTPAGGTYSGNGVTNGMFDPAAAGVGSQIITYTYTATNGCSAQATQAISVNNGPPKPSVTYANFVLKAAPISTSYTYQWLDGQGNAIPGATDTVYTPTAVGNYAVRLTFLNGCENTSANFMVSQIGLAEYTIKNGINIFPNPARDVINAEFLMTNRSRVTIKVMDVAGKVVFAESKKYDAGMQQLKIDVSEFAAGAYFLEISDGENSTQQRFVKE